MHEKLEVTRNKVLPAHPKMEIVFRPGMEDYVSISQKGYIYPLHNQ